MTRPAVQQPLNPGEVFLGANRYLLAPGALIQRTKMTQMAPALRTGNAEHADDQIASAVIWDDLTGGIGVINMDEQQSPDRFSDSSLNTMVKNYWTLPPKVHTITLPSAITTSPFFDSIRGAVSLDGYTYAVLNTVPIRISNTDAPMVEYYDSVGLTWVTTGGTIYAFGFFGTADPVVWKGNIWYPTGLLAADGMMRYDVAAQTFGEVLNASGATKIPAYRLAIFDEDLYILAVDGHVYSTDTNGLSVVLADHGAVDTFSQLNGLTIHRNQSNDPAPIIATEGRLLSHDVFVAKMYSMGITFNDLDPDNGKGLTTWDGDVWFGKGSNLHQVSSGARVVRGPNTGDGLLKEMQGHITDLDSGLDNYLVYCIAGGQTYHTSSIMAYNRKGHHVLAKTSPTAAASSTDAFTRADSAATMTGGGKTWTAVLGTWGITSNTAYCAVSAGVNAVMTSGTQLGGSFVGSNHSVQVTLTNNVAGTEVMFRGDGGNNYYMVHTYASGYRVYESVGGVLTLLQTIPMAVANNDVIRVDAYGPTYTLYVNGVVVFRGSIPYKVRQYVGLGTNAVTTPRFDNFSVVSLVEPTTFVHYQASRQADVPGILYFNGGANTATTGTNLQYIKLFDTTDNPNQFISSDFETSGSVTLPWFDANLADVSKAAYNVQIRTLNCTATETVIISYSIDDGASYTQMYTLAGAQTAITTNGVTTLYFNTDRLGTLFYKVRLKVTLASGSSTLSPVVVFTKLRYSREFDILYSYTMDLDLDQSQPDGTTPNTAIDTLDTLVESKLLCQFAYHSGKTTDTKDVFVSTYAGPTGTANDRGGRARVTVVEVFPQP